MGGNPTSPEGKTADTSAANSLGKTTLSRRGLLRVFAAGAIAAVAAPFIPSGDPLRAGVVQAAEADIGQEFTVTGPMFEAYQKNGGRNQWGHAISDEYMDDTGRQVQFFEKGAFQIRNDGGVEWMNIYQIADEMVKKGSLTGTALAEYSSRMIPLFRDWSSDNGKVFSHTVKGPNPGSVEDNHIETIFGELDQKFPQLRQAYFANPLWFDQYGLPMGWQEYDGAVVVVCQRTALQLWKDKTDWTAYPRQVVASNAGEDAKRFGMIPADALKAQKLVEQVRSPEVLGEFKNRVGWAYSPLPELSSQQINADVVRMREGGANIVYIGHINPGDVEEHDPNEPGLGPTIHIAIQGNTPGRTRAESFLSAVNRTLEATRNNKIPVVLPVGYQIQMGEAWNRENASHLRREPDGSFMNHWGSGRTASPYSPAYRRDIEQYYRWVNNQIIAENPHVLALNLGDEPMGGDFSSWAKDEFRRRYGVNFDSADPRLKGEFQAGVLADHASWSANIWQQINPTLKTMMTFHIQRETPLFPNFEEIFRRTPNNFVFSEDTHMHDGLPERPISYSDRNLLYGMVRTLSWLSNVYSKPLMLWSAANGWGLANHPSQAMSGGGINEARENIRIVTDIAKQNGGLLDMVMAWAYNMRGQGLYEYGGSQRPYSPEDMFSQITRDMAVRRDTLSEQMPGKPEAVIYVPADALYRRIGQENVSHLAPGWIDLNKYDFIDRDYVCLTDGPALDRARREGVRIIQEDVAIDVMI